MLCVLSLYISGGTYNLKYSTSAKDCQLSESCFKPKFFPKGEASSDNSRTATTTTVWSRLSDSLRNFSLQFYLLQSFCRKFAETKSPKKYVLAFYAQLTDKLHRSPSNLSDIGGLWANIHHTLLTIAETVYGFECSPQRNPLQSAIT